MPISISIWKSNPHFSLYTILCFHFCIATCITETKVQHFLLGKIVFVLSKEVHRIPFWHHNLHLFNCQIKIQNLGFIIAGKNCLKSKMVLLQKLYNSIEICYTLSAWVILIVALMVIIGIITDPNELLPDIFSVLQKWNAIFWYRLLRRIDWRWIVTSLQKTEQEIVENESRAKVLNEILG